MRRRDIFTVAAAGSAALQRPAGAETASLGFALGNAVLHGWTHVGIVRACARLGLRPAVITGSSAGAAVGALWAAGLAAEQIARVVSEFGWAHTSGALSMLFGVRRRNDRLREAVDRAVGGRSIEQLPVRFAAVASDALTGDSLVIDRGPVGLAVEASCAAPLRDEPVPVGGRPLIDGGLTAPLPVAAARRLGAERVVAVDVAYRPYEETPSSASDHAFQALHILSNALAREQARGAALHLKLDVHHLMHGRLDTQALILAGEQALMRAAPAMRGDQPAGRER